ncbi:MAG: hypothetical protein U0P45_14555 [Acidimicrobiales bacterium]
MTAPSNAAFGDAPVAVSATSTSPATITWSTSGPCTYGAGKVTFTGAGNCVVTADQAATANYLAASVPQTIVVGLGTSGLSVTAPSSATYGDVPVAVSATSASSGAITWWTTGPCAYAAGKVSFSGAGDCVVTADQAATVDYAAATASKTIVVGKATTTLTITAPTSVTFGDAPVDVSATSASTGAISWSTDGPCTYAAGKVTFTGPGACSLTADQATDANHLAATATTTITVDPLPLTLDGLPAEVTVGDQVTLTAGGFHPGEAVTFTFHSVPIDLATVDADALGTASADIVVPDEPGDHTITATGGSSGLEASANTFVKALVTTTTTSTTTTAPPTTTSTTTSTTTTAPPTTTTAPPTTTSTTTTTTTAPPTTTTAPPTTTSTTTSTTSTTTPPTTSSTTSTTSTTTSTTAPPTSSTTSTTTSTIPGSSTSTTGAPTSSTSEADGGSTTTSEGGDVASGGADQGSGGQGDVGSGTLARTGSSTGSPVLLGATLVALGAAFVALSRRRLRRAA